MKTALKVLAECVDVRTGQRFTTGEIFDPAPTLDQAKRLITGGCLPEAAMKEAIDQETSDKLVASFKPGPSTKATVADLQKATDAEIERLGKAAAAEIERLNNGVTDARTKADADLKTIADELDRARKDADGEIANIKSAVATARGEADAEIAKIAAEVNEARETAKSKSGKKD